MAGWLQSQQEKTNSILLPLSNPLLGLCLLMFQQPKKIMWPRTYLKDDEPGSTFNRKTEKSHWKGVLMQEQEVFEAFQQSTFQKSLITKPLQYLQMKKYNPGSRIPQSFISVLASVVKFRIQLSKSDPNTDEVTRTIVIKSQSGKQMQHECQGNKGFIVGIRPHTKVNIDGVNWKGCWRFIKRVIYESTQSSGASRQVRVFRET